MKQGDEGGVAAWIDVAPRVGAGLQRLRPGEDVLILTWLHQSRRDVLAVHPRGEPRNPLQGVLSTRSPDRPNPIGLHRVTILAIHGNRVHARDLEAIDQTPVLDIKPVLAAIDER